ncbi:MAG: hypothetical protein EU547_00495 [Promethearchaeota archaeon]|nr:MAG: hypothetical protein EU547_00495 [Candidatus Lokiarchaeota archaeon]
MKYNIDNFNISSHALLFRSGGKKLRGISILEIKNIPKNISTRENRVLKKNIERITFNNQRVYFHYHLTVLLNYIPRLSYEISIHKNKVRLRFILTIEKKNKRDIINELKSTMELITEIYQTSFPGLTFELLNGDKLRYAWSEIFGGLGEYKIKILDNDCLKINQNEKDLYLKVFKILDKPQVKADLARSQIDSFISSVLGGNFYSCSFVINFEPLEIVKFPDIKKKYRNLDFDNTFDNFNDYNSIRKNLLDIRHSEITALWRASAYIVLRSIDKNGLETNSQKLMAILDTVFSGKENSIEIKSYNKNKIPYVFPLIINRNSLENKILLTSEQLAAYIHLPEESFPSINRSNIPLFEMPTKDIVNEKISIGKILFQNDKELFKVGIDIEDLRLNMFVTGLIGMGKTTLVMNVLNKLSNYYPDINWIVLDWKGDYSSLIKNIKDELLILRPGSEEAPFQINMFNPEGANQNEHARKLLSLFIELFKSDFQNKPELSVQMERVCREVIYNVTSDPNKQSLKTFFDYLDDYTQENLHKNRTIGMTTNALINRFDRFRSGNLAKVFDVKKSNVNFNELMNKKVVFDFNYLLSNGGTKQDVRFLMNLILKYVIDRALQRGLTNELEHIVVIEDSQLLVPAVLREVPETSMGEDIPLLLRGVGEGMITIATRPEISPDIISNSGIKISFKSTYDSKKIANYQNLNREQEEYLKVMPKREAIVSIPSFAHPFRIMTEEIFFNKCLKEDILRNNKRNFPNIYSNCNSDNNIADSNLNKNSETKFDNSKFIETEIDKKIESVLEKMPKNKYEIGRELKLSVSDIEQSLNKLVQIGIIKTEIAPIFSSGKLQKLYYYSNFEEHLKNEIRLKIEKEYVHPGTFGLVDDDKFDYIWYTENILVKIYVKPFDALDKKDFIREISDLMTSSLSDNIFNLILIVPFIRWKNNINKWLEEFDLHSIDIYAYEKSDWENLKSLIKTGKSRFDIHLDREEKETSPSNETIKKQKTTKNFDRDHNKVIEEIIQNNGDIFPIPFLKRLEANFPNEQEVYEYLRCDHHSINGYLKPIKRYIKEIDVHDVNDPVGMTHTYYGWNDIINGRLILKNKISDLFSENSIAFINDWKISNIENENTIDIFIPNLNMAINIIYEHTYLLNFKTRFLEQIKKNPNFQFVIVSYSTEIKDIVQKKLKAWNLLDDIKIIKYDWSDIDPWIRKIKNKFNADNY